MTTYATTSVTCGACGGIFTQQILTSTNRMGSPDLDTRPPAMERSTMQTWVERCPSCGYCAHKVSKFEESDRETLNSANYRAQLADATCPTLASTFICLGMLAANSGREPDTGWAYLQAAWVLDDFKQDELARMWRSKAADIFLAQLNAGKSFAGQPGGSEAVTVDCLRRAGRGAEAVPIIQPALSKGYEDVIQKILFYQQKLIEQGDIARHLIKDALEVK